MRFAVESWAPEYGSPSADPDDMAASDAAVDIEVEVPAEQWGARCPGEDTTEPGWVVFTDGVRRVDGHAWVEASDGTVRSALCASYAAGAVRCDGRATLVAAQVRRGLFTSAAGAEDIATASGPFPVRAVGGDSPGQLSLCLQQQMAELEAEVALVAAQAGPEGVSGLVCVDGPLRGAGHRAGTVGYVKTHQVRYLPPEADAVVAGLGPGQRTPLFLVTGPLRSRYCWYLRLPGGGGGHSWAGVVRCEIATDMAPAQAAAVADRVALTLPRFASAAHKDPRAPQNLYPIAGLERALRHRLGDANLVHRSLRAAATASTGAAGVA
jgi:hypothetical protein